jgi:hypothetical protein
MLANLIYVPDQKKARKQEDLLDLLKYGATIYTSVLSASGVWKEECKTARRKSCPSY